MPGAPGAFKTLAGSGALTFNPSLSGTQRAEWNLSQLASIAGAGSRRPYLKFLLVEADIQLKNSNAAARTVQWQRLYEILFGRGIIQVPGHAFVDAFSSFGRLMLGFYRLMCGRNPEGLGANPTSQAVSGGAITDFVVPGANGTLNAQVKILVPFFDLRGVNGEDHLHHAGVFQGGSFQLDWGNISNGADAAGAGLGADVWVHSGSVRLSALLKKKDDVRFAPWFTIMERQLANLTDFISPEGVLYTDLWLEAVAAATGLLYSTISTTQVSNVTLTMQQGERVIDGLPMATIVAGHNAEQPTSSEAYLAQPETGNLEILPLFQLAKASGKLTHIVPEIAKPQLQLTGTLPVAQAIVGMRYVRPSGPKTVEDQARRANEQLPTRDKFPNAVIASKTDSKQPVKMSKGKFLAQKVYRFGVPGSAA
jgi:hypothetical protein